MKFLAITLYFLFFISYSLCLQVKLPRSLSRFDQKSLSSIHIHDILNAAHFRSFSLNAQAVEGISNKETELMLFKDVVTTKKVSVSAVKAALKSFDERMINSSNSKTFSWNVLSSTMTSLPLSSSSTLKLIEGKWELIFSTLIPIGYLPVYEICDFYEFSLKSSINGIPLGLVTGRSEITKNKYPIEFGLTTTGFSLGFFKIKYDEKKLKTRTYTFLYVDKTICVARSSSGGYSILKRVE